MPDAEREHQAVADGSWEQGAGDGVEPQAVAEEARGQHQRAAPQGRRAIDDTGHGPAPHPRAARRTGPVVDGEAPAAGARLGQFQPTSSIRAMASSSSGTGLVDGDRVDLDVGPVRMCSAGGTAGLAANSLRATISSWAGGEVRNSIRAMASSGVVGPAHDTGARHVGVGTGAVLVGPRRSDGEVGVLGEGPPEVVVVAQAHVAVPGGDGGQHLAVGVEDGRGRCPSTTPAAPWWRRGPAWRSCRRRGTGCTRCSTCAGRCGRGRRGRPGPRSWSPPPRAPARWTRPGCAGGC